MGHLIASFSLNFQNPLHALLLIRKPLAELSPILDQSVHFAKAQKPLERGSATLRLQGGWGRWALSSGAPPP